MDSDSDSSVDPPEEISSKTGNEQSKASQMIQSKEIHDVKQKIRNTRKLIHERNKLQKEGKNKRLEELEKKKLPLELLNAIKHTDKLPPIEISKKVRRKKKLDKKSNKPINKDVKVDPSSMIQVRSLDSVQKGNTLASIAAEFRNKRLYNSKSIPRMPSSRLRVMAEKRMKGKKY